MINLSHKRMDLAEPEKNIPNHATSMMTDKYGEAIIPVLAHLLANCKISIIGANQNTACVYLSLTEVVFFVILGS